MSNYSDWDTSRQNVPAQWPAPGEATVEHKEPTVEENANMIRQAGEWLAKKAVEASGLAQRVTELEDRLQMLRDDLSQATASLVEERKAHEETQRRLANVEAELARKESTVHDLVIERDIALGERNAAQAERDSIRSDRDSWQSIAASWEHKHIDLQQENHVLRERCERMAEHIRAFKTAYAALSEAA